MKYKITEIEELNKELASLLKKTNKEFKKMALRFKEYDINFRINNRSRQT